MSYNWTRDMKYEKKRSRSRCPRRKSSAAVAPEARATAATDLEAGVANPRHGNTVTMYKGYIVDRWQKEKLQDAELTLRWEEERRSQSSRQRETAKEWETRRRRSCRSEKKKNDLWRAKCRDRKSVTCISIMEEAGHAGVRKKEGSKRKKEGMWKRAVVDRSPSTSPGEKRKLRGGAPPEDSSPIILNEDNGPPDVFDSYLNLLRSIFDFKILKALVQSPNFTFCYDARHGVGGIFARKIFIEELGAPESSLLNCDPEDLGGGENNPPEFGASANGVTINTERPFVTPADSIAIIAANAGEAIPHLSDSLKGVTRCMPTSAALDVVLTKRDDWKFSGVPTGWRFFGDLTDAGECCVLGEQSFGMDACVKDGIWASLSWLSILAFRNIERIEEGGELIERIKEGKLVTIEEIVREHWSEFGGRHYYARYDYENVKATYAKELMDSLVKPMLYEVNGEVAELTAARVHKVDEFSKHKGIRYHFNDSSRLVFYYTESGQMATVQIYVEQFDKDHNSVYREAVAPLTKVAGKLFKMDDLKKESSSSSELLGLSAPLFD